MPTCCARRSRLLFDLGDESKAVQVVQHDYQPSGVAR